MTAPALQLSLAEDQLDQLADLLADRVREKLASESKRPVWVRGAKAAAEYCNCPASRIYDLVAQRKVQFVKDGSRLMFRAEWLDEISSAPSGR